MSLINSFFWEFLLKRLLQHRAHGSLSSSDLNCSSIINIQSTLPSSFRLNVFLSHFQLLRIIVTASAVFLIAATMTTYGTIPTSSDGGSKVEFLSRATERIQTGLGTRRPWKEMFNLHSINIPHGFADAISRIKTNFGYFLMNYVIIVLIVLFLSLLWHPISLIVFVVTMAGWLFLYFLHDEPLVIFHHTIDDRVIIAVLSVVTLVLLLLTGATMNILLSVLIGLVVVVIHAVLRKTDDLCLDEDGVEAGGYLEASTS